MPARAAVQSITSGSKKIQRTCANSVRTRASTALIASINAMSEGIGRMRAFTASMTSLFEKYENIIRLVQ